MTEETARLDYSKPPPGYYDDWLGGLDGARRWKQYKTYNDPPGHIGAARMVSVTSGARARLGLGPQTDSEVRAAAWAWHDRRHRMIDRGLAFRGVGWASLNPWPRCLTWTDEQVAEVEAWLLDSTTEMPEVLRG